MILNLITFSSIIHKNSSIRDSHEVVLSELEKYFTINFVVPEKLHLINKSEFSIVFIASGGVERMILQHFESLPRPMVMLADGINNSLASAMEVSAWLRDRGVKSEILHGDIQAISKRLCILNLLFNAQCKVQGARIGVMGTPSSWLIASNVDYLLAKRRWGVEYVNIPLDRIVEAFHRVTDDEVGLVSAQIAQQALACREGSPQDMLKAMRLYRAIKNICEEEHLQAITVSCFKLIEKVGATGCLALALLNDEGILAGCEGDLQSIFTMLTIKAITNKSSFMGNPSMINNAAKEIILTHCSIGLKQTEQYIIRNHFESGTGIAIQGILPIGDVTIVKCGGEALDEYFISSGSLTENTNYINMCRTQVRIHLDNPTEYFLRSPLGNHHLLVQGNHEMLINEFLHSNGCKRIGR